MHTKSYIPKYPRPQLVRNNWINLEGEWDFMFDDNSLGKNNDWQNQFPKDCQIINVPYSYHTKSSGINDKSYHKTLWYQKYIIINKIANEKVILNFEASDYYTELYINGNYVGNHKGGYNRFSFDITKFIKKNEVKITLYIEDDMSKEQPRGKQRYKKENFECWYVETSGLWKIPWIEIISSSHIVDYSYKYTQESLNFNINTNGLKENQQLKVSVDFQKNITKIGHNANITMPIPEDVIYWSHENPKLYDIEISIIEEGKEIDKIKSYIGIRFINYHNEFSINSNELYLKMILDQGYFNEAHLTATEDDIIKDINLIISMGFNGIRKHQKIESQLFNYYCDILGIYTWQEMPSHFEFTKTSITNFKEEWFEMVNQYQNHPSIITWVPFNESWGIKDIYDNIDQQKFADEVYDLTKSIDNSRPIVSNDGWEQPKTDIITIHNYSQDSEVLYNTYKDINLILTNQKIKDDFAKNALAKGYEYNGQPIMITEYAGIAFNDDSGWGYGEAATDKKNLIDRLFNLTKAIHKLPFINGYCITQLTDVQQEVNGLLKEDRTPKISLTKIKSLNNL